MFTKSLYFLPVLVLLTLAGCVGKGGDSEDWAPQAWPAESWQEAVKLTGLDPSFRKDLSGAHWNPVTESLFVVINKPGKLVRLERTNGVFTVTGNYFLYGDLEAVTQRDTKEEYAFVLDEKGHRINKVRWDGATSAFVEMGWDIRPYLPKYKKRQGPEGMAFIPNRSLRDSNFTDPQGKPRGAKNGLGGLMFVAHQFDGRIYVFDLSVKGNDLDFVGS